MLSFGHTNLGSCLYIFNIVVVIIPSYANNIVVMVVSRLNRETLLVWLCMLVRMPLMVEGPGLELMLLMLLMTMFICKLVLSLLLPLPLLHLLVMCEFVEQLLLVLHAKLSELRMLKRDIIWCIHKNVSWMCNFHQVPFIGVGRSFGPDEVESLVPRLIRKSLSTLSNLNSSDQARTKPTHEANLYALSATNVL